MHTSLAGFQQQSVHHGDLPSTPIKLDKALCDPYIFGITGVFGKIHKRQSAIDALWMMWFPNAAGASLFGPRSTSRTTC